jgi:prophage antirepressor-like protein
MTDKVVPFDFNGFEVRTLGTWDAPLFVAADVCAALGIVDVSNACKNLDDDEKGAATVRTPGGNQELLAVSESGLYSLILRSRKPQAKNFKKWITSEVIPSIRKTGSYSVTSDYESQPSPRLLQLQEAVREAECVALLAGHMSDTAKRIASVHLELGDIDPRQAQMLIDRTMQRALSDNTLPPANAPRLSGAVEIAENLGFRVGKEENTLGKHVAKAWRAAYDSEPQECQREVGGASRGVKAYPSSDPVVVAAIKDFYSDRAA